MSVPPQSTLCPSYYTSVPLDKSWLSLTWFDNPMLMMRVITNIKDRPANVAIKLRLDSFYVISIT